MKQELGWAPLKPQARSGPSGSHAPVEKLSPGCLQTVPQHTEETFQMYCLGTRNTLIKNYTKISQKPTSCTDFDTETNLQKTLANKIQHQIKRAISHDYEF